MKVGVVGLSALLQKNVVEIKFRRRHNKPGWSPNRRMLCTNDFKLLNSTPGHIALNYKMPHHPPPYPATIKNLVCAWDIMWQNWRMINCDLCEVVAVIPSDPPDKFWQYFSDSLHDMSPDQKISFMNA